MMCPYCGEDVPADSGSCWKCGTAIEGGGYSEGTPEIEGGAAESAPTIECPHCEAEVNARALRCNKCGQALKEVAQRRDWGGAAMGAFLLVGALIVGGVAYSLITREPPPDPARAQPLGLTFAQLSRIYLDVPGGEQRKQDTWARDHQHRYVEWEHFVLELDEASGVVQLGQSATAEAPCVTLTLERPSVIQEHGLRAGKTFKYSGRLEAFDLGAKKLVLGRGLPQSSTGSAP